MIYDAADKAIREMNRANIKAFGRLKLMDKDSMNIIREIRDVYEASYELARRKYLEVGREAFETGMIEAGTPEPKERRRAMADIDADWALEMLEESDPVTLYAFVPEMERKASRLVEAISAAHDKNAEIDKALRYWTVQVGQYADNAVYKARLEAFKAAGVAEVMWVSQKDERVCADCDDLDGQVFQVENAPPPQHIHCRCYLVPVGPER